MSETQRLTVGTRVAVYDTGDGKRGYGTITQIANDLGADRLDNFAVQVRYDGETDERFVSKYNRDELCVIEPEPAESYHDRKFDQGKPRPDLIPGEALEGIGEVLAYGAAKYAEDSWQFVPDAVKRYRAALLRHMAAIQKGETHDPESGKLHIDHVATNAAFLQYFARRAP